MNTRTVVLFVVASFLTACGLLVMDAVRGSQRAEAIPLSATVQVEPADSATGQGAALQADADGQQSPARLEAHWPDLAAVSGPRQTVTLGAIYPDDIRRTREPDRYKFKIELTTLGAAIQTATLSEFDDRDPKGPRPLELLAPLHNARSAYPLANTALRVAAADAERFGPRAFPLDRLNWQLVETDNRNSAVFEAELFERDTETPTLRLRKTYRISPGSYDLDCSITAENLTDESLQIQMDFYGPAGMAREDVREDMRRIVAAYRVNTDIETRVMRATDIRQAEQEKIRPPEGLFRQLRGVFSPPPPPEQRLRLPLNDRQPPLMWTAATNKYFAAILRPVGETLAQPGPVRFKQAAFLDAALMDREPAENAGAVAIVESEPFVLAPAGQADSRTTLAMEMFLGPKDNSLFEAVETYRVLQYFQTIDFRGCCCPGALIRPLAFGIIWLIQTLYTLMGPLGNYGVVIIFLVFVVRLVLHPVTKRSQVSMMKMQKLGPRIQEIQKKYAGNKQEMQRKTMEVYREMGASPVAGMLPMFLQMPIWIGLWTAVYTSVDLRGQPFLPFWITDLSAPDQLFRFPFGITIPFFGEHLNLLPLLMGGVMYAQQKLMPSAQAATQSNPQVAQQQKMMMIMFPLMFPLFLYNGPSGVNLYIMSSIGAGVIEQMVIRKHIREKEALQAQSTVPVTAKTGGKAKKKKPKPMYRFDRT